MAETVAAPPHGDGDLKSLAHQINVAIASSHTKINRLILDRMPKAVPPQTENPSAYITGLLHIGAVYIAFESLWQNILGIHSEIAPIPYTFPFTDDPSHHDDTPQITERTRHILDEAYWSNMLRAARVKADIRSMTGWPEYIIDEQIRLVGTTGRLGEFTLHIRDSVNAKPHLLLAYAYCLYMALLSGGSYIRTELMYLKSNFWQETPTPVRPNMVECGHRPSSGDGKRRNTAEYGMNFHELARHDPSFKMPLDFLDFDPSLGKNPRHQAKELKTEFKRRFAVAEQSLADLERKEIIKESSAIFHHLEGVVDQLDQLFGTAPPSTARVQRALYPLAHASKSPSLGFRLRDSIAIAKGRLLRTRRKSSMSSVAATAPTVTDNLTDFHSSKISKPSSASDTSGEYKDAQAELKRPSNQDKESDLARQAMVPSDGFRTIRYEDDVPRPDRIAKAPNNEKADHYAGLNGASFGRANSDVEYCPMTRASDATKGCSREAAILLQKDGPNYALYAVISNFVLLLGIASVFAAYLFVRHGEMKARSLDL